MLTRSAILATTLAIGLVGVIGSSALAVAFVPGNESGSTQDVPAIAVADQDPAVGTSSAFLAGVPAIVPVPAPIALDDPDDDASEDGIAADEDSTTGPAPATSGSEGTPAGSTPTPTPSTGNNGHSGSGNSGNGNGNSGSGNSGNGNKNSDKSDKDKKDKEGAAETAE